MSEPPLILKKTLMEIEEIRDRLLVVPLYPNHNQAVERCIKFVTDASKTVYGFNTHDGLIRAKLKSRKIMPMFNSKQDYKQNFLQ